MLIVTLIQVCLSYIAIFKGNFYSVFNKKQNKTKTSKFRYAIGHTQALMIKDNWKYVYYISK